MESSRAASTSSNKQNGTGLTFRIANKRDIAVNVFSPPDNNDRLFKFFPEGTAFISIPVSKILSGSVSDKEASPPLK